jgi:hypothetical protein
MAMSSTRHDIARNELRASGVSKDALAVLIIEICTTDENDARRICDRAVTTLQASISRRPQR